MTLSPGATNLKVGEAAVSGGMFCTRRALTTHACALLQRGPENLL